MSMPVMQNMKMDSVINRYKKRYRFVIVLFFCQCPIRMYNKNVNVVYDDFICVEMKL